MKTRSKSVPKIGSYGLAFQNHNKLPLYHERPSLKIFTDKIIRSSSKNSKIFYLPNDKPPIMYTHQRKSYEKLARSSPTTRIKKIIDARLLNFLQWAQEKFLLLDKKKALNC